MIPRRTMYAFVVIATLLLSLTTAFSLNLFTLPPTVQAAPPADTFLSKALSLLQNSGMVAGTVYAEDGVTPLANVSVTIDGMDIGTCSDADGQYLLIVPLDEPYLVVAGAESACDGGFYAAEWWPEATTAAEATAIVLSAGNTVIEGVDFTLSGTLAVVSLGTGSISGIVTENDGSTAIPGAQVCLEAYDWSAGYGCQGVNPDGTYTFGGLPTGTYRAVAQAPGFADELYSELPYFSDRQSATPIDVTDGINTPGVDFTLDPGGTISGTVYAEDGTTPLGGVPIDTREWGGFGRCTNPDGTYTLEGLPLNTDIYVMAGGEQWSGCATLNRVQQYWDHTSDWNSATAIVLTAGGGEDATMINFSLAEGGSISGIVTESDGTTPIEGLNVCINEYDSDNHIGCANSAADGTYQFSGLASGDYRVNVDTYGTNFISEYYNDQLDWSMADRVTVTAPSDTPNIDFALEAGGSISGIVTESDGSTPISDARVCVEEYPWGAGYGCQDVNPDGTYTFNGLPTGTYRATAQAPGFAKELFSELPYYGDWSSATPVNVTAGSDTPDIDFTLDPGGTISGTVYAEDGTTPLGGVPIDTRQWGGFGQCTNPDGTYTLEGLPLNTDIYVMAGSEQWGGCATLDRVQQYWDHSASWNTATPIQLTSGGGENATLIDFALGEAGSISGIVTESDGTTPIPNVQVCINWYDTDDHVTCQNVNPDGTYFVGGLASGDYRVNTNTYGTSFISEYFNDTLDWGMADRVTVTAPSNTPNIDFALDEGGTLSGVVTESDGTTPIPNAQVCVQEHPWGMGYGCQNVNPDGTYTFSGLPAGTYRADAQASGYAKELYNELPYLIDHSLATPISVTLGSDTPGINFTLDPGGTISGTVYADDGTTPLGGVPIDTRQWGGFGQCTNPDGTYTLEGLPLNTDIYVLAGGSQWGGCPTLDRVEQYWDHTSDWNSATAIVLTAGGGENANLIDFALEQGGSISGIVTEEDGTTPIGNAEVCVSGYDFGGGYGCYGVNPDGTYLVVGLPSGDYSVFASAPGFVGESYDDVTAGPPTRVAVVAPTNTPDIDFALALGGTISGIVTEEDGTTPIPNARVCVRDFNFGEIGYGCFDVNGDGTYTVGGFPAGSYRVDAQANGFAREIYNGISYYGDQSLATPVSVTVGVDTPNIDFALGLGGSISFTVLADDGTTPLGSVPVDTDPQNFFDCSDSSAGTYTLFDLPLGVPIYFYAGGQGWWGCSAQNYIRTYWPDAPDKDSATPIILTTTTPDVTGLEIQLSPGGTISGVVTEADGTTPIEDMQVCADNYDTQEHAGCNRTAADGTYAIEGVKTGDYRVHVVPDGTTYVEEYYNDRLDYNDADRVTVTAPSETSGIDFALIVGGTISGTVYDTDGVTPLSDVWVGAHDIINDTWHAFAQTTSSGQYTKVLAPSTYHLMAIKDGYALEYYDDVKHYSGTRTEFVITSGSSATGIDFVLEPGGTITGTVYEADGVTPVEGVRVGNEDHAWSATCTAADGTYTIATLPLDAPIHLYAAGDVHGCANSSDYDREWWEEAADIGSSTPIILPSGSPSQSGIDFTLTPVGSISGIVTETDGTTPIAGVNVCVNNFDTGEHIACEQTAADGTYQVIDVPGGDYRVDAYLAGYASEYFSEHLRYDQADRVIVVPPHDSSGINFTLEPGGSISGIVTENDGTTPIAGLNVCVNEYDTDDHVACGQTAADGTYQVVGVPGGDFRVNVDTYGTNYVQEYYNDQRDWSQADRVTVTPPSDTPNINFALEVGGSISGIVTESDGTTPISGLYVCVNEYDTDIHVKCEQTAADGTYQVMGVPGGDHRVNVDTYGTNYVQEYYNDQLDWNQADRVTVTPLSDTSGIDFALEEGGSVSGIVTEDDGTTPLPSADVCVETYDHGPNGPTGYGCMPVNADGTYTFAGLPADNYRVEARAPGYEDELWEETVFYNLATPVAVTALSDTPNINFTLGIAGSISGLITETDGTTPIGDAEICINEFYTNEHVRCRGGDVVNPDGTYMFDGLATGDYRVEAYAGGYVREYYDETPLYSSATPVHVNAGFDTSSIDFTLELGGSISGIVTESDGTTPLAGMQVCVNFYDSNDFVDCRNTEADGTYFINGLLSEDYRVNVNTWGTNYIQEFYNETPWWDQASRVTVTAPGNTPNINFTIDLGGSLSGIVTESDGTTPIGNAQVCVQEHPWGMGYGCQNTNPDGTYTFMGLPTGVYRADAHASGYANELYDELSYFSDHSLATQINVTAGSDTPGIDFTLDPGGTISGTVYAEDGTTPLGGVPIDTRQWGGFGQCTNPDGTYLLEGLPLNTDIYVMAGGAQWGGCSTLDRAQQYWDHAPDMGSATAIVLTVGSENVTNIDFALAESSTVSGTITGNDSGLVLSDAEVQLQGPDGRDWTPVNPDGTYTFDPVSPGTYQVWARAPEYVICGYSTSAPCAWVVADSIVVPAASNVTGIDIALYPAGSVTGLVTDSGGFPLANIFVSSGKPWVGGACTDVNGEYRIDHMMVGESFTLSASMPTDDREWWQCQGGPTNYAQQYYDHTYDRAAATQINPTTKGQLFSDIDFSLEVSGVLSGTITDQDTGTPIANAQVILGLVDSDLWNSWSTWTDGSGYYQFEGMSPGPSQYIVSATSPGYVTEWYDGGTGTPLENMGTPLTIPLGTTVPNIDIPLGIGGSISGTVTDQVTTLPVANILVRTNGYGETCTDGSGNYTLTGIPAGTNVEVVTGGTNNWPCSPGSTGYVEEWYDGVYDEASATPVVLATPGEDVTGIDFSLDLPGTISGTIYDTDGTTPLDGVRVGAHDIINDTWHGFGETGSDGQYLLSLSPSTYHVLAFKQGYTFEYYDDVKNFQGVRTEFVVTLGSSATGIDFVMEPGGTISGTVYAADGVTPLEGVRVGHEDQTWSSTCTAADGTYTVTRLPLDMPIHMLASGGEDCPNSANYVPEYWQEAADYASATPITIPSGSPSVSGIDFTLMEVGALPANTELVRNGDFAAGEADWTFWGSLTHSVVGGVLNLTNTNPGGMFQDMGYAAPAAAPFELTVELGNTSAAAKDVQVIVHDGAFTDVLFCAFTVPVGQPLDTFTLRGATAASWPDIRVEVIPQTFDGQPTLEVDNVSLQYQPGLSVTGVECVAAPALLPENTNLVTNGDFPTDDTGWTFWGSITHSVVGGVLNLTNTNPGGLFQDMTYPVPSSAPFELTVELGNTSAAAKDVQVIVHDGTFSDVLFCAFTVPVGQPLDTFTLRGATTTSWSNIRVEVIPQTFDGQPALEVDNVDLQYQPGLAVSGTDCVAAASALPENTNLVTNGGFPTDDTGWTFWGSITHSVVGGVLNLTNTNPGGMFQDMTYPVPSSAPFELTVDLGNTSAAPKNVQVIVHDGAFTDVLFCPFTLQAGQPLDTFTLRGATTTSWSNIRVEVIPQTFDGQPALEVDNVDLQYQPGLAVSGTDCVAAPALLPENTNLVTNGDFLTDTAGWIIWGSTTPTVSSGVLNLTNTSFGGMFQDMGYPAPPAAPFELTVDLGNSSAANKDVQVMVHDGAFSDVLFCAFTVPAGQALDTFTVRGQTTMAWSNIRVEIVPQTFDGLPALEVDNVTLQYQPGLAVSGTECVAGALPDNTNLVRNGDFPTDTAEWIVWGSTTPTVSGGVLNLTNTSIGGMFQDMGYPGPNGAPLELTLELGNTSAAAKDVRVMVHDGTFSDVLFCAFTVPAGQALDTFTVRGKTVLPWPDIRVEILPQTFDGQPALQVDNVNLQYKPSLSVSSTECLAAALPDNTNLVQNGDFPTDTANWVVWGSTAPVVSSGVLNLTNTNPGGMFQDMGYLVAPASPFELTVDLGNTSAAAKNVQVMVHDGAFTDVLFCAFTVPAGQALDTFTVRGATAMAWSKIRVEVVPQTFDGQPALQIDNVNLQYQPGLAVSGTDCVAAAAPPSVPVVEPTPTGRIVVEAESGQVAVSAEWASYATELASGGMYIYSSGSAQDTVNVVFSGTQLDVIYVQHPALGSFDVIVDGTTVATVNTSGAQAFGPRVSITGLVDGVHQAQIVPAEGATVALDAFEVEALAGDPVVQPEPPAEPTDEPVAEPTPEPTDEPIAEPTAEPEAPVNPSLQIVESEAAGVLRSGSWSTDANALASGGSYLYSSGSAQDVISLTIAGTQLDVIYIQHPALGSFTVVVDGAALAQIDSRGEQAFGQRVSITGLPAGEHVVQIVPVAGAPIAIDAFAVEARVIVEPTPEPTEEPVVVPTEEPVIVPTEEPTEEPVVIPTEEPTPEPTEEPTAEPTDEPTPEPLPTDTPVPPPPPVMPGGGDSN